MSARKGDAVSYRSISGQVYDAVLASEVSPVGFVAVEVSLPGTREPVKFSRVKWREAESSEVICCWPRGK